MNGDIGTSTQTPQLRALLFTDLCDSLILVERIGDSAAAELFQQHDRLVLTLQQQWNGHQIDRSDGLFLLFERAIDALGFALDYQRGLQQIGEERGIVLRARSGLHVGEVLTWENSPEAIKVGAKSLEVEGLAKPMAARLMTLARPGQILLSAVAESLTHRVTGELGERGERLLWKSHGRWRFKGVPTTQEVFEVGEIGFAPLRMPRGNAKARRDIPLWRQPPALAAEALLVAALAVGGWMLLRPEPAIAFAERDWVVVGDVNNLTGNVLLDDSLRQAFRISLEQSRFVNVLSDMKVRDTLTRMRRAPDVRLDRRLALEVAARDGARAIILPSVLEVHGKLRVSVEVVDPASGETVYSDYADGRGLESVLASTDHVVASLRGRLGEALQDIDRTSAPLPEVATANLDALNAYAKGLAAYGQHRMPQALAYFEQATRLDPEFAFAYLAQLRIQVSRGQRDPARELLAKAVLLRDRLTAREALYLDAWKLELSEPGQAAAAEKWKLLADLYPDHHGAHINYGLSELDMGRYAVAEQAVRHGDVMQYPLRSLAVDLLGRTQLAQNKFGQALRTFNEAAVSSGGQGTRQRVAALAASGDVAAATRLLGKLEKNDPGNWLERTSLALDQGNTDAARRSAQQAAADCGTSVQVCELFGVIDLSVRSGTGQPPTEAEFHRLVQPLLRQAGRSDTDDRGQRLYFAAVAVYAAQRAGLDRVAPHYLPTLLPLARQLGDARAAQVVSIVDAVELARRGKTGQSVARLKALEDGSELYQVHSALRRAYLAEGAEQDAERERQWLLANRGRAYAESAGSYAMQALNVHDARLAVQRCPAAGCPAVAAVR